jgi:hypothetical protein
MGTETVALVASAVAAVAVTTGGAADALGLAAAGASSLGVSWAVALWGAGSLTARAVVSEAAEAASSTCSTLDIGRADSGTPLLADDSTFAELDSLGAAVAVGVPEAVTD